MNDKLKQEIDNIPVPRNLHQRSQLGVQSALAEMNAYNKIEQKKKRSIWMRPRPRRAIAALVLGITIVSTAFFNTQVFAALRNALHFVPGIGIVTDSKEQSEMLILPQQVDAQVGEGSISITGMMVDEEMSYITVTASHVNKLNNLTVVNDQGVAYTVSSSQLTYTTDKWAGTFWYKGTLDIGKHAKIKIDQFPEVSIPLTLIESKSVSSYDELGETVVVDDVQISAVASLSGEKARISLVSTVPDKFMIDDYGLNFTGSDYAPIQHVQVWDDAGKPISLERGMANSSPVSEFLFNMSDLNTKNYIITIPEINVIYQDEAAVSLDLPKESKKDVDYIFDLAGFPIKISAIERFQENGEEWAKVYVDTSGSADTRGLVRDFSIDGRTLNDETGIIDHFVVKVEPTSNKLQFTVSNPQVAMKGPWTFKLPVDSFTK
ncbi:hypothetical protein DFQ01_11755 [Paenibacillus cellulosilyticus]|uniref:DUF4179 domain-containing protein n=1 Tax=Paenibacillus cellulosilyticus TaxID=375489 RepID=A0A2V2YQ20_9BACL|nr:hypothetical protein [Paenibacillus cellulosilyticus]PWV98545.1 hypothetical protein DFQ01_11755 [Paenibacillus cellulosilyticus]QKS44151.1 hypothetical protein HUB94_06675 [Paenibacillus cellulosilyticus]